MHVQLLVKVNYNMMITTTSIVGTYHHHINLKWNSLGHNQMRKRGHTIKKKGHIFSIHFCHLWNILWLCTTFLEDFFFIPYTMPIIMHCYFINWAPNMLRAASELFLLFCVDIPKSDVHNASIILWWKIVQYVHIQKMC